MEPQNLPSIALSERIDLGPASFTTSHTLAFLPKKKIGRDTAYKFSLFTRRSARGLTQN